MKRKIILLVLILAVGFLAFRLFISNFSSEPIEIIPKNAEKISEISAMPENPQDKPKEEESTPEINEKEGSDSPTNDEEIKPETKVETTPEITEEVPEETTNDSFIINKKVSWGYAASSGRTIDTIVVHSSYDALGSEPYSVTGLIDEYKQYGVAPHFLIDRKGNIYRLIDEKNIAYHAGVSKTPDGRTGVNGFSIGIEMMNTKEDDYTSKQYSGLNNLIDYLENQYSIKYVLGHEDISPNRKTDPWNFNWDEVNSKKSIH